MVYKIINIKKYFKKLVIKNILYHSLKLILNKKYTIFNRIIKLIYKKNKIKIANVFCIFIFKFNYFIFKNNKIN